MIVSYWQFRGNPRKIAAITEGVHVSIDQNENVFSLSSLQNSNKKKKERKKYQNIQNIFKTPDNDERRLKLQEYRLEIDGNKWVIFKNTRVKMDSIGNTRQERAWIDQVDFYCDSEPRESKNRARYDRFYYSLLENA